MGRRRNQNLDNIENINPDTFTEPDLTVTETETDPKSQLLPKMNMLKMLPTYDGSQDGRNFIDTVESVMECADLPTDQMTRATCLRFTNAAARWLREDRNLRNLPWLRFREEFLERFSPLTSSKSDLERFLDLRQTSTVPVYVNQSRDLLVNIPPQTPQQMLIRSFILGLESTIRDKMLSQYFEDIYSCVRHALKISSMVSDLTEFRNNSRYDEPHRIVNSTRNYQQRPKGVGKNCPFTRQECEKERRCFICGARGHITPGCPERNKGANFAAENWSTPSELDKQSITTVEKPSCNKIEETRPMVGVLPVVEVNVRNPVFPDSPTIRARALLDSGSNVVCFAEKLCRAVKAQRVELSEPSTLSGFANQAFKTHLSSFLQIGFQNRQTPVEVVGYVVPDLSYDLILGIPALQQLNIEISWKNNNPCPRVKTLKEELVVCYVAEEQTTIQQESQNSCTDWVSQVLDPEDGLDSEVEINDDTCKPERSKSPLELKMIKEFNDLFPQKLKMPPVRPWDMVLELRDSSKEPYAEQPYRIPVHQLQELWKQLKELLEIGFIKRSVSAYSAPARFVKKKDTTAPRLVNDFRILNRNVVKRSMPIPRPEDIIHSLRGKRVFSKIDLRKGFHQIRLKPESTHLTAFATPFGLFEWLVVPFGLQGGPATFIGMMYQIFEGLIGDFTFIFFDDILVASDNETDHEMHLREVFGRLRENSLFVHRTKTSLFQTNVEYLGFLISTDGLSILPQRIRELEALPRPKTTKELQSALGKFKFCQRFIKNFSDIIHPLQCLVNNQHKCLTWNAEAEVSWSRIVKAIQDAPCLAHYDPQSDFEIYTDASGTAIGAVLMQDSHPIEYLSRTLSKTQQRYSVYDREFLAIVSALRKWQPYIALRKVYVFSDHKPLKHVLSQKLLSDRQIRWLNFLSLFDLSIDYIPGYQNIIADYLSRPKINSVQVRSLKEQLVEATTANADQMTKYNGTIVDGLLIDNYERIIVPPEEALRRRIIEDAHSSSLAGHFAADKTIARVRQLFTWIGLHRDVIEFCKQCHLCQVSKHSTKKPPGFLHPLPEATAPWKIIHADFLYVDSIEETGDDTILVFLDRFSHRCRLFACSKHLTALQTAEIFINEVVKLHGIPDVLITDRDNRFTSDAFDDIKKVLGMKLTLTTARHPETNGLLERTNRTILQLLRQYTAEEPEKPWTQHLTRLEVTLNSMPLHSDELWTPFFLDTGTCFPWTDLAVTRTTGPYEQCIKRLSEHRAHAKALSAGGSAEPNPGCCVTFCSSGVALSRRLPVASELMLKNANCLFLLYSQGGPVPSLYLLFLLLIPATYYVYSLHADTPPL